MPPKTFNFTTGPSTLPDVGKLSYEGCVFSPLFETKLSGKIVKDNANRTTKFLEYVLTADGYVTLPDGASDINPPMNQLRQLLTRQGGVLIYEGRGFDLIVNNFSGGGGGGGGGGKKPGQGASITRINLAPADVAWGPVPELIEFQPLGAGRSAKVQWQVTIRIPEIARASAGLLQLNYQTTVTYGEDYFSTLSIAGTLEIPLTRFPSQSTRTLTTTVDNYRQVLEQRILTGIDLSRFRITNREFAISRDKRTLEFHVTAEERPYMDMPPDCTIARGTYSVRPAKVGLGLVTWLCTLKATYTVRRGAWRRTAWLAFLALVRLRMNYSVLGNVPSLNSPQEPQKPGFFKLLGRGLAGAGLGLLASGGNPFIAFGAATVAVLTAPNTPGTSGTSNPSRRVWLLDFNVDEGLYLDSKTITFSVTWRLITSFSHIMLASGIWRKLPDQINDGKNLWAASMKNISGVQSWLPNGLDPSLDVIVDFGDPNAV